MFRIVCAPNAFKESLSASDVCAAIERGCARAAARLQAGSDQCSVDFKSVPMADGGDGSIDVLVNSDPGARRVSVSVLDPVCRVITAEYGVLDGGATAIIEMARASGLWLVSGSERDATRTTSFGTGQLLAHALETLPSLRKVIMCIGGSATNDGGAGFAAALGYQFLDEKDEVIQHPGSFTRTMIPYFSTLDSFLGIYRQALPSIVSCLVFRIQSAAICFAFAEFPRRMCLRDSRISRFKLHAT